MKNLSEGISARTSVGNPSHRNSMDSVRKISSRFSENMSRRFLNQVQGAVNDGDSDNGMYEESHGILGQLKRYLRIIHVLCMTICFLYSMSIEPARVAFLEEGENWYSELEDVSIIVDVFFCFGLISRFVPNIPRSEVTFKIYCDFFITRFNNRKAVTEFMIDLLSSFPFYRVWQPVDADPNPLVLLRNLRILQFIRTFGGFVQNLSTTASGRRRLEAGIFMVYSGLIIHQYSCLWYLCARWSGYTKTWTRKVLDFDFMWKSSRYMIALQDVVCVMRTRTDGFDMFYIHEYALTFILMLMGTVILVRITSSLANIVFQQDKRALELEDYMRSLDQFATRLELSPELRGFLIMEIEDNQIDIKRMTKKQTQRDFQQNLLMNVDEKSRRDIALGMFEGKPIRCDFFRLKDSVFIWTVVPLLRNKYFDPKQVVYRMHDRPEMMYFLVSGLIKMFYRKLVTDDMLEEDVKSRSSKADDLASESGNANNSEESLGSFAIETRASLKKTKTIRRISLVSLSDDANEVQMGNKKIICVGQLYSGQHFGEKEVLNNRPRKYTCRSEVESDTFLLSRTDLMCVVSQFPEITLELEPIKMEEDTKNDDTKSISTSDHSIVSYRTVLDDSKRFNKRDSLRKNSKTGSFVKKQSSVIQKQSIKKIVESQEGDDSPGPKKSASITSLVQSSIGGLIGGMKRRRSLDSVTVISEDKQMEEDNGQARGSEVDIVHDQTLQKDSTDVRSISSLISIKQNKRRNSNTSIKNGRLSRTESIKLLENDNEEDTLLSNLRRKYTENMENLKKNLPISPTSPTLVNSSAAASSVLLKSESQVSQSTVELNTIEEEKIVQIQTSQSTFDDVMDRLTKLEDDVTMLLKSQKTQPAHAENIATLGKNIDRLLFLLSGPAY